MAKLDSAKVRELLDNGQTKEVKKLVWNEDIPDLAIIIDQLPDRYKLKFYLLLPTKMSSDVLLEVSQHSRKFILKSMKDKYIISLIEQSQSDDSADILGDVPEYKVKHIVEHLPKHKKDAVAPLIKYEEDTAGHLMQSELISLQSRLTTKQAIISLKKELKTVEGINYVYVVDNSGKLKGVVSMQDLLIADPTKKLVQVMNKEPIKVLPTLDKEKVAEIFRREDMLTLPVVDKTGLLLGRVTVDDVLDVMEEEATEDMFMIAGVHPDENIFDPYSKSLRRRLPWLIVNLVTAMLAGLTVAFFENTLQAVVILAAFMPIIAGMGGNAGTQTLTIVIRGIALGQLDSKSYRKVLWKELSLGITNGLVIGLMMGLIAYLWLDNLMIGVVILLAMMINLIVASIVGTSIPLFLKSLKIDPAVASSVFMTTFTDVVGFFSFLGIATLLLNWIV